MKKIFAVWILAILGSTTIFAQDNYASTLRMGPFKIGMNLEQVELVTQKQIATSEAKITYDNYEKWYSTNIDGVVYKLGFEPVYNEDEAAPTRYTLSRIKCSDVNIKTKSGIAIGMTRAQVLAFLDKLNMTYHYSKFYEVDDQGKKNGTINENFELYDDSGKMLRMELKNGKVAHFVCEEGGDGC